MKHAPFIGYVSVCICNISEPFISSTLYYNGDVATVTNLKDAVGSIIFEANVKDQTMKKTLYVISWLSRAYTVTLCDEITMLFNFVLAMLAAQLEA